MLAALERGDRKIIEQSSGNTGLALVCVANALGIPVEIAVPERIPDEKKVMLRFLGAKVREADDAFKYASFYKEILETESGEIKVKEYDLCGFVCPLSKIKATEVIDNLDEGETIKIILGDTDSLKSVAEELKTRGLKPGFKQEAEDRFVLTITK